MGTFSSFVRLAISVGTLFDGFDCLCCVKQEPKYPMFCS